MEVSWLGTRLVTFFTGYLWVSVIARYFVLGSNMIISTRFFREQHHDGQYSYLLSIEYP